MNLCDLYPLIIELAHFASSTLGHGGTVLTPILTKFLRLILKLPVNALLEEGYGVNF